MIQLNNKTLTSIFVLLALIAGFTSATHESEHGDHHNHCSKCKKHHKKHVRITNAKKKQNQVKNGTRFSLMRIGAR